MSIVQSTKASGESLPVRINVCKYCSEHFATQTKMSYACRECVGNDKRRAIIPDRHAGPKPEWTLEEIMDREG